MSPSSPLTQFLNGVGGNFGAIFASRLSSALHSSRDEAKAKSSGALLLLNLPIQLAFLLLIARLGMGHVEVTPTFVAAYLLASTAQVIIVLLFVAWLVHWLWGKVCVYAYMYVCVYLCISVCACVYLCVCACVYTRCVSVHCDSVHRVCGCACIFSLSHSPQTPSLQGVDPDNYASPLLAAFADVLGTILLVCVFAALFGPSGDTEPALHAANAAAANGTVIAPHAAARHAGHHAALRHAASAH